jgi:hypothetical protein
VSISYSVTPKLYRSDRASTGRPRICSSCGVGRLGQATESCFGLRHSLHDGQDIPERTREPVELQDHEHITLAALILKPEDKGPPYGLLPLYQHHVIYNIAARYRQPALPA